MNWPIAVEGLLAGWSLLHEPAAGMFLVGWMATALGWRVRASLPPGEAEAEEAVLAVGPGAM
jgi:hypothetical protein